MPNRGGVGVVERHRNGGAHQQHEPLLEEPEDQPQINNYCNNSNNNRGSNTVNTTKCCSPNGCHMEEPIKMEDLHEAVKVICNNDQCLEGRYMHKSCFEYWEESVLTFLKSCGRARSWSEKQRLQNLWTKKGYDLAYKACGCRCGKGHLRKDLDWIPPAASKQDDAAAKKKKKGKKKNNDRPSLTLTTNVKTITVAAKREQHHNVHDVSPPNGHHHFSNQSNQANHYNGAGNGGSMVVGMGRNRTSSMSSNGSANSGGGASPPIFGSETPSPDIQTASIKKLLFGDSMAVVPRPLRERHNSGSIFNRRSDYSNFNSLPRHKINSYHIKMEDDNTQDDTRNFLLQALSGGRVNRVHCVLCQSSLPVFDRYPLIDGTFFLSPRKHLATALPVTYDQRPQFLNAVCMGCLEGWNAIRCRDCHTKWSGSHLILGSMYSYDIFAAVPCCIRRLLCNGCEHPAMAPDKRLEFFSDYSHAMPCAHCKKVDHHFVKPLGLTFVRA